MNLFRSTLKMIFVTMFLCIGLTSYGETIRLANSDWYPYQSEKLKHHGFVSRIVTEAFASQGIQVEYEFLPWARAFEMAKTGIYDGSLTWVDMAGRDQYFWFTDHVITGDNVLFHLKSAPFEWRTLKDLEGMKLGMLIGYGQPAVEMALNDNIERVSTEKQNFEKLLRGRIDIFIMDKRVGYANLNEQFSPELAAKITHHNKVVNSSQYRLVLSKKVEANARRVKLFNEGLRQLRANGRYQQFIDDYYAGR